MTAVQSTDVGLAVILLVTAILAAFILGWILRGIKDGE